MDTFRFMQRLLDGLAEARYLSPTETGGAAAVHVARHDGIRAQVWWSPAGRAAPLDVEVPAGAYVCDAAGRLVAGPAAVPTTMSLAPATSTDAGGAVRLFVSPA